MELNILLFKYLVFMKKVILTVLIGMSLSSCCTLFTSSRQDVTFMGPNGTKIYEAATNLRIAEIKSDNTVTVKVKKRLEDKQLIAKKEGYENSPFILESSFNSAALWNLLFWPGFLIDLGTQKINKWDNPIVNIELDKTSESGNK